MKDLSFEEFIYVLKAFECGDFSALDDDVVLSDDNYLTFKSCPVRYIAFAFYSDEFMKYFDDNYDRIKEKSETTKRKHLERRNEAIKRAESLGLIGDELPF